MAFGNLNNLNSLGGLGTSGKSVFSPSQLGNLSLWFDATRNVYSDSGTTPCVNGDPVQQWNDQSTSAKNLSGVATARPTYNTNIQNGLPGITFDGVNDVMATAAMTLNQPITVFIVMNQVTWTNQDGIFDGLSLDTMLLYQDTASPQLRAYSGVGGGNFSGLAVNTPGIMNMGYNGASSYYRLNNGAKVDPAATFSGNPGGLTLGREFGLAYGNFVVNEFILYNTALSDSSCALVNRYLGTKWGITVS